MLQKDNSLLKIDVEEKNVVIEELAEYYSVNYYIFSKLTILVLQEFS
jgi:hypothetical protein